MLTLHKNERTAFPTHCSLLCEKKIKIYFTQTTIRNRSKHTCNSFLPLFMTMIYPRMYTFVYVGVEIFQFSLHLIYRSALHTGWVKYNSSRVSVSQKYSQPLQLQKYIRPRTLLGWKPVQYRGKCIYNRKPKACPTPTCHCPFFFPK